MDISISEEDKKDIISKAVERLANDMRHKFDELFRTEMVKVISKEFKQVVAKQVALAFEEGIPTKDVLPDGTHVKVTVREFVERFCLAKEGNYYDRPKLHTIINSRLEQDLPKIVNEIMEGDKEHITRMVQASLASVVSKLLSK